MLSSAGGTLLVDAGAAGGSIADLLLVDGGDCCLRIEGGSWSLSRLRLRCAHGAALLACGGARVSLTDCVYHRRDSNPGH